MRRLIVDLGATWLRARLTDDRGGVLRRWKSPAVRWSAAAPALRRLGAGRLDELTIGAAGLWSRSQRSALAKSLSGLARRVRVLSDAELAREEAFGSGPGILLIAGTGSIALGQDGRGRRLRAGGLGPLLGDEGSAFWIGRAALREPRLRRHFPERRALRLAHDASPVRAIAALAPRVLALARRDRAARAIVSEGASHLARLALDLRAALDLPPATAVRLHGSLFKDALVVDLLRKRLKGLRLCCPPEPGIARMKP